MRLYAPPPLRYSKYVERAYSVIPVRPSVCLSIRPSVSVRVRGRDGSNLRLSFSGVSNLHLSFQAGAFVSFGRISSFKWV